MVAKDKARELVDRFDYPNIPTGLMSAERKQCAIICVDELIEDNAFNLDDMDKCDYWKEVKQEIEKL